MDKVSFLSRRQWKIHGEAKDDKNFILKVEKKELEIVIGKEKKVLAVKKILNEFGELWQSLQTELDQALVLTALGLLPSLLRMWL